MAAVTPPGGAGVVRGKVGRAWERRGCDVSVGFRGSPPRECWFDGTRLGGLHPVGYREARRAASQVIRASEERRGDGEDGEPRITCSVRPC